MWYDVFINSCENKYINILSSIFLTLITISNTEYFNKSYVILLK